MNHLILVTSEDCPLCHEAKEMLKELTLDKFTLEEEDIYSSRELYNKYWDKIPVLIFHNRVLVWPFNLKQITNIL